MNKQEAVRIQKGMNDISFFRKYVAKMSEHEGSVLYTTYFREFYGGVDDSTQRDLEAAIRTFILQRIDKIERDLGLK